ncbi:MAG TPA: hypothetical protein VG734_01580 [Lacunisphaera sp.]|nr:hypothetical protein [Lacunisphaera sp.]
MNAGTSFPFLAQACLRARRVPLLGALALALAGFGISHGATLGWWPWAQAWAFVPGVACLGLVGLWLARGRTLTPTVLARRLDEAWALSARLESAVELDRETTPLAVAQRLETAERTARRTPPHAREWAGTLALVAVTLLLVLGELGVSTLRSRPATVTATTPAPTARPDDFSATITWRKPPSEIKATAIEEVPLAAEFTATAAPTRVTLQLAVNGEPRPPQALAAADLAKLSPRGPHPVELSLYLDELGAQEYDIVAYHLRAEFPGRTEPTASPLQFIQVRPPREDVRDGGEGSGQDSPAMITIRQLKAAQLQLIKANFLLLHAPGSHAEGAWTDDNQQVATEQKVVAGKTDELRLQAIAEGAPSLLVFNLVEAAPLMDGAAASIAATHNADAVKPQNRALALLTETEKLLTRVQSRGRGPRQPQDPFRDAQQFRLPNRPETPAGRLEELARKQAELAQQLESGANTPASAQEDLARKLEALAAGQDLNPAAQGSVAQAARDAAEAAQQLARNDRQAARSPATSAATRLAEALVAQEAAGRKNADAELETARRELAENERQASEEERLARLEELARSLQAGAEAQQRTGSAEAARALASVGQSVAQAAGNGPQSGEGAGNSPGEAAARAQAALAQRQDLLARASRQLERTASELRAADAGDPHSLSDAQLGAELAAVLLPSEKDLAQEVDRQVRDLRLGPGNGVVRASLRHSLARLVAALETARASGRRDEFVRRFNSDDLDPAYRKAIEKYFEQLSRRPNP